MIFIQPTIEWHWKLTYDELDSATVQSTSCNTQHYMSHVHIVINMPYMLLYMLMIHMNKHKTHNIYLHEWVNKFNNLLGTTSVISDTSLCSRLTTNLQTTKGKQHKLQLTINVNQLALVQLYELLIWVNITVYSPNAHTIENSRHTVYSESQRWHQSWH